MTSTELTPVQRLEQYAERARAAAHHYGLPDK